MKVFYKNLNSVRFIAASLVIIHHIEQYKWFNGLPHYFGTPFIKLLGWLGVNIFFVLSGFLITSLLIIEKGNFKKIDIKKFYIRRVLRIWPLYFFVTLLAFFVWPYIKAMHITQMVDPYLHFWPNLILIIAFLPNLQLLLFQAVPYCAQIWSIGIEEQFYLVWPWFLNLSQDRRHFKKIVIVLLAAYLTIKISFYIIPRVVHHYYILDHISYYLTYIFQIDSMMIGALFALFNFEPGAKKLLTNKYLQIVTYLVTFFCWGMGWEFSYFYWEIYGVLFAIIIFNLANAETSIFNLEYKWLSYLGKTSYSLYMLHVIIVNVVIRFVTQNSLIIYPLVFALSIGVAILSYEFFEKRFLRVKSDYAKVQAGADPKVGM